MKIVTLVKYVPDATGDRSFTEDRTVDREVDGLLSELDEYAVEQALRLVDEERVPDDTEIVALTVGPDDAADAIKRALQMGAGSGVHVCDDAIAGSDAFATSAVLAAAIAKLEPDLVITGMSSTDGSMGVMAALLSERLGWPALSFGATLDVDGTTVTIRRDGDLASQTVQAELPAVVSVTDQSGEARYPSMKGILAAKKKPVQEWSIADLDLDPATVGASAAWTAVVGTEPRPPKQSGQVITDADGSGAGAFVEFLSTGKYV